MPRAPAVMLALLGTIAGSVVSAQIVPGMPSLPGGGLSLPMARGLPGALADTVQRREVKSGGSRNRPWARVANMNGTAMNTESRCAWMVSTTACL